MYLLSTSTSDLYKSSTLRKPLSIGLCRMISARGPLTAALKLVHGAAARDCPGDEIAAMLRARRLDGGGARYG